MLQNVAAAAINVPEGNHMVQSVVNVIKKENKHEIYFFSTYIIK